MDSFPKNPGTRLRGTKPGAHWEMDFTEVKPRAHWEMDFIQVKPDKYGIS